MLHNPRIDLIAPTLCTPQTPLGTAPLQLIIFPNYRPNHVVDWQQLSPAQAGLALMQCLINARNLSNHGFNQIAELARNTPTYRLDYSSFDQLTHTIGTIQHIIATASAKVESQAIPAPY